MAGDTVKWVLSGLELIPPRYTVLAEDEEDAIPERKGDNLDIPSRDGVWHVGKRAAARVINLGVVVRGTSTTDLQAAVDELRQKVATTSLLTLDRYMADGTIRRAQAEVRDSVAFADRGQLAYKVALSLLLPTPWFFATADTVHQETNINNVPRLFTVNNPGTVQLRHGLTITIWTDGGPTGATLTAPKITNNANGVWVKFDGVVNPGQTLVIDVENYTATLDGANVSHQILHDGDPLWLTLEPGDNDMRLDGSLSGQYANLEFRFKAPFA